MSQLEMNSALRHLGIPQVPENRHLDYEIGSSSQYEQMQHQHRAACDFRKRRRGTPRPKKSTQKQIYLPSPTSTRYSYQGHGSRTDVQFPKAKAWAESTFLQPFSCTRTECFWSLLSPKVLTTGPGHSQSPDLNENHT